MDLAAPVLVGLSVIVLAIRLLKLYLPLLRDPVDPVDPADD